MALLLKTAGEGKMNFAQLIAAGETNLFPTGRAVGIPERDLLAALAGASRVGNEPDQFSTLLRTALIKSMTHKGEALTAAQKLGFHSAPEVGALLTQPGGLIQLLRRVQAAINAAGPEGSEARAAARQQAAEMFGQSRSFGTVSVLLSTLKGDEEVHRKLLAMHGPSAMEEMFGKSTHTILFQFHQLGAQAHNLLYELGTSFAPDALKVAKTLLGVLDSITKGFNSLSPGMKTAITDVVFLGAVLSPAALLLSGMLRGFGLLLNPLKWAATGLGALGTRALGATDGLIGAEAAAASVAGPLAFGAIIAGAGYAAYKLHLFGESLGETQREDEWAAGKHKNELHRLQQSDMARNLLRHPFGAAHGLRLPDLSTFNRVWAISQFLKGVQEQDNTLRFHPHDAEALKIRNEDLAAARRQEHDLHVRIPLHIKVDMSGREITKVVQQVEREHRNRG
jgi:hypothetical protein